MCFFFFGSHKGIVTCSKKNKKNNPHTPQSGKTMFPARINKSHIFDSQDAGREVISGLEKSQDATGQTHSQRPRPQLPPCPDPPKSSQHVLPPSPFFSQPGKGARRLPSRQPTQPALYNKPALEESRLLLLPAVPAPRTRSSSPWS